MDTNDKLRQSNDRRVREVRVKLYEVWEVTAQRINAELAQTDEEIARMEAEIALTDLEIESMEV